MKFFNNWGCLTQPDRAIAPTRLRYVTVDFKKIQCFLAIFTFAQIKTRIANNQKLSGSKAQKNIFCCLFFQKRNHWSWFVSFCHYVVCMLPNIKKVKWLLQFNNTHTYDIDRRTYIKCVSPLLWLLPTMVEKRRVGSFPVTSLYRSG